VTIVLEKVSLSTGSVPFQNRGVLCFDTYDGQSPNILGVQMSYTIVRILCKSYKISWKRRLYLYAQMW